jgi:(2Fe-2S) ferredoxin
MNNKFFERHVFCCTNQRPEGHAKGCCANKQSVKLRAYMKKKTKEQVPDKKIRINASGCLDHCEHGPAMVVYPDNVWYSYQSEEDIDLIIQEHLINDIVVEKLLIKK